MNERKLARRLKKRVDSYKKRKSEVQEERN
jgi:hypothetical protein